MKSIVVPVRLHPDMVRLLDEDVRAGRACDRSDALRQTLFKQYGKRLKEAEA